MDDLVARFLPRFVESANERLRHATELLGARDFAKLGGELHTLAGEASVLGLAEISTLARSAEQLTRRGTFDGVAEKLAEIERHVAALR
jgi:HPt (histidine-containing phosphotransfer) domain-containing protein